MKIKLKDKDILKLKLVDDYELNTLEEIDELQADINETIGYWLTITEENIESINLGKYYVAYLLPREFLEFYMENTTSKTSKKIKALINPADLYFQNKMNPKTHQYEIFFNSLKGTYFWRTHSIHPVDLSNGLEKDKAHPNALAEFDFFDFFWEQDSSYCLFGDKFGKTSLLEFREWRVRTDGALNLIDCYNWIFDSFEIEKESYNHDFQEHQRTDIIFDRTIISTGFGQFADEGRIDPEALGILKIALERLILFEDRLYRKVIHTLSRLFTKDSKHARNYVRNLKILLGKINRLRAEKLEIMLPPWLIYPEIKAMSIGWRMGDGEAYLIEWGDWYEKLSKDEEMEYQANYPPPSYWFNFYKIYFGSE